MQIISETQLVALIEAFLDRHGMAPSTFGSLAKGEAQFLAKLKEGRSPSLKVTRQVLGFMADRDGAVGHDEAVKDSDVVASSGTSLNFSRSATV